MIALHDETEKITFGGEMDRLELLSLVNNLKVGPNQPSIKRIPSAETY